MKDKLEAVPNANGIERKKDQHPSRVKEPESIIGWWLIGGVVFVGAAILTCVAVKYRHLEAFPAWVSFLSTSILSLLLLAVVIAQAYIYHLQRKALSGQLDAMQESVEIARKAFYVGEAPYFDTSKIRFYWAKGKPYSASGDRTITGRAQIVITFMNGGRTPAWHFSALPHLELGESSQEQKKWIRMKIRPWGDCPEAENTFYPSGAEKCIAYETLDELSPSEMKTINAQKQMLFLIIDIGYTDINNDRTTRQLLRCFNPVTQAFGDCGAGQDP